MEMADFTIDLTSADSDLIKSTDYSTPSPGHQLQVPDKAYLQMKGKVKRLNFEKRDLEEKIKNLTEKLKKSKEHSVK